MKITFESFIASFANIIGNLRRRALAHRKRVFLVIAVCVALAVGLFVVTALGDAGSQFKVIYSLDERQNDKEIIKLVDDAEKYAYFAVYYFTQKYIAEALMRAKRRGIEVRGITDRVATESANREVVSMLRSAGIPVGVQKHQDGIMHMKVLVTDKAFASGSYNWTGAATEANDEVLEISTDEGVRKQYLEIVKRVLAKNDVAEGKGAGKVLKIDYTEAPDHIGEYAEVSGTVLKVYESGSGTVFLDYCKSSAKCPFTVVIFASDKDKFSNLSKYQGEVTITGIIRTYKGKAEIVVSGPDQIVVD
mgnify:CR=1 FL=1